jgi:two-component system, chemotaxis family, response regulator Rcp1
MFHVLLVEDNGADVLMVREAIRTSPVEADLLIAYDGHQAIRFLTELKFKPDLIILDLNIPKFSGLQILERQRSQGTPVIVLTSSLNPEDKKRAMELGAREYINKPSELDSFIRSIQEMLQRWSSGGTTIASNPAS